MQLKEQFQIKTVPAFQTADGTRFHDIKEAQGHTREQMLQATVRAAIKDRAEFSKLDNRLLVDFLLLTGKHVGAVMAEPLEALLDQEIENRKMMATHVVNVTGKIDPKSAERMAQMNREHDMTAGYGVKIPANAKPRWDTDAPMTQAEMTDNLRTIAADSERRAAMPKAANPDIFGDEPKGLKDAMAKVDRDIEAEVKAAFVTGG
jgi:hypothetical protein